jgi:hypothetical protein
MHAVTKRFLLIVTCLALYFAAISQPMDEPSKKASKPYRILTSGKQVTVKSTKNIKNIMVWTATGHRIVEQRDLNLASFSFNVNAVGEKVFFVMVQYESGKPFTEKFGVQ